MVDNCDRPREYDAVFGSQHSPPPDAVVLGGIEGVKQRLASPHIRVRIAGLFEAIKYGETGLNCLKNALDDDSITVQNLAYQLLHPNKKLSSQQPLKSYSCQQYCSFKCLYTIESHTSSVFALAFSPNNRIMASGSPDRTIRIWDFEREKLLGILSKDLSCIDTLTFSPNGRILYSNSVKGIKTWNLDNQQEITTLEESSQISSLVVTPMENPIGISRDGNIIIWHRHSSWKSRILGKAQIDGFRTNKIPLVLRDDGNKLFIAANKGKKIIIWDLTQKRECDRLINPNNSSETIQSITISKNGTKLVCATENEIDVWNLQTREKIYTFPLEQDRIKLRSIVISPDGNTLFSSIHQGMIKIWNLQSGKAVHTLRGHGGSIASLVMSSDGKFIASGSFDKTIKIWGRGREYL